MNKTVLILMMLLCAACSPQDETIRVGVIAPMTGDFATYGTNIQQGIELADQDIEVIYEDACLPKDALTAARKLIDVDQADFITGVFCIVSVEPIMSLAEDKNVMMVAAVSDDLLGKYDNLASAQFSVKHEAEAQAEYARELGAETASILYIETPFGMSYDRNFGEKFEELGGTIVSSERAPFYSADFRAQLTKIKAQSPDVVLIVHAGNEIGIILQQAHILGIEANFIGTYEAEDQTIIDVAGIAAEGFIVSAPQASGVKYDEFEEEFVAEYGKVPTSFARNAHDALLLQLEAFRECGGNTACMNKHVQTAQVDGASGSFSIGADNTAQREIMFKEVRDGVFVER